MKGLSGLLYKVLDIGSNNFVRSFITSMGIGIATGAGIYLLIESYINRAVQSAESVPYVGLLGLFGIDSALSILLGAVLTRAAIEATKPRLVKK